MGRLRTLLVGSLRGRSGRQPCPGSDRRTGKDARPDHATRTFARRSAAVPRLCAFLPAVAVQRLLRSGQHGQQSGHPLRHRSREDDLCRILARNRRRNALESAPGSRRRHENRRQRERLQRAEVPLHAPVGPGLRNPRGALHARLSERSILRQPVLPHAEPLRQTRHFEHDHQDACPVPLGERSLPHLLPQLSHRLEQDKHLQRQLRQDRSGVRVGRQQREPAAQRTDDRHRRTFTPVTRSTRRSSPN